MDVALAPPPEDFCPKLTAMHRSSKSPTGKFGYHVQTCDARMVHTVDWQENWTDFYRNLFLGMCKLDLETNGPWPEMECATAQIVQKVIPRLLSILRAEGRTIEPAIIYGDLWKGGMSINMEAGESLLFDTGSYFAHNEMELGPLEMRIQLSISCKDPHSTLPARLSGCTARG